MEKIKFQPGISPSQDISSEISNFLNEFIPLELLVDIPLLVMQDKKSDAFYTVCHLDSKVITTKTDLDAVLDPMESEDYKLNREIYEDAYAYKRMEKDASLGRSFEDLVIEYTKEYRPNKPLKVFGGQHRIMAISKSFKENNMQQYHGARIYFKLNSDQKIDIAIANNTAIAISNDLLDRMHEDHLGPDLRKWCQTIGILDTDQNFSDKRNPDGIPTVRTARTLIVNFILGSNSSIGDFHLPKVCSSGKTVDEDYLEIRENIDWKDNDLIKMGEEFSKLHKKQRNIVLNREIDNYIEFANKATHPCVTAAWAYAAGYLNKHKKVDLKNQYLLSDISNGDPLNAKALLGARLKGVDPDNYRGLGSRINNTELGRMLEVFLLQATQASTRGITKKLANAAIKSYEAKKRKRDADNAIKGL